MTSRIERVEVPQQVRSARGGRKSEYPFNEMEPGDSVRLLPEHTVSASAIYKVRNRVAVKNFHAKESGRYWKVGQDKEGIWRIWRLT